MGYATVGHPVVGAQVSLLQQLLLTPRCSGGVWKSYRCRGGYGSRRNIRRTYDSRAARARDDLVRTVTLDFDAEVIAAMPIDRCCPVWDIA